MNGKLKAIAWIAAAYLGFAGIGVLENTGTFDVYRQLYANHVSKEAPRVQEKLKRPSPLEEAREMARAVVEAPEPTRKLAVNNLLKSPWAVDALLRSLEPYDWTYFECNDVKKALIKSGGERAFRYFLRKGDAYTAAEFYRVNPHLRKYKHEVARLLLDEFLFPKRDRGEAYKMYAAYALRDVDASIAEAAGGEYRNSYNAWTGWSGPGCVKRILLGIASPGECIQPYGPGRCN